MFNEVHEDVIKMHLHSNLKDESESQRLKTLSLPQLYFANSSTKEENLPKQGGFKH